MEKTEILIGLQRKGFKLTKARTRIVELFLQAESPLAVPFIVETLNNEGLEVNKTTVYREIDFLLQQNLLRTVDLRERGKRYEFEGQAHHHHLICINCKKMEDFESINDLREIEKRIGQEHGFTVMQHSLEFYGLCRACSESNAVSNP